MIITGTGNMDTITAPKMDRTVGFKVYDPQASQKDNSKIYEQIFVPKSDEVAEIPAVSFSYFDPGKKRYYTVTKGPFPIKVIKQAETDQAVKVVSVSGDESFYYPPEKLGKDIVHIKTDIGTLRRRGEYLYKNTLFWVYHIVPLVMFFIFSAFYRERRKIKTDHRYARLLKAPGTARKGLKKAKNYLDKGNTELFYDAVYKTLQGYLSSKLLLPKGNISAKDVQDKLGRIDVQGDVGQMVKDVFAGCDMARYASMSMGGTEKGRDILIKTRKIIDFLEKNYKK